MDLPILFHPEKKIREMTESIPQLTKKIDPKLRAVNTKFIRFPHHFLSNIF